MLKIALGPIPRHPWRGKEEGKGRGIEEKGGKEEYGERTEGIHWGEGEKKM